MSLDKIRLYLTEYSHLKSLQNLLAWDMETMMPPGAIDDRAKRLSYINGKIHAHITSKKYQNLLTDLQSSKLTKTERRLLRELNWDVNLHTALPRRHVEELAKAQTVATHVWAHARSKNDWEVFLPHLENLIDLKRQEASFYGKRKPYDALLQLHDKEYNSGDIERLFHELKKGLAKLTQSVEREGVFSQVKELNGKYPKAAQQKLNQKIARVLGLPTEYSRLDESAHPFSINISPRDQRITTRYDEKNLESLYSTMHEVGHALYELGLPPEWEGTPLQESSSLSLHESQSRFWENIIGRSKAFCSFLLPELKSSFPQAFKKETEEDLFLALNRSVPGLIRVESSELYYNFHIIIRFELELLIFNEGLEAFDLPSLWNEKYKNYLGLRPKSFQDGILQDSHWAGAAFGYFPTYTLGNLISASLWRKMNHTLTNLDKQIKAGDFSAILSWLKDNLHSKGRMVTTKELVGDLQVGDYLNYLKEKFHG
jgi:carboxypeptidase Taq